MIRTCILLHQLRIHARPNKIGHGWERIMYVVREHTNLAVERQLSHKIPAVPSLKLQNCVSRDYKMERLWNYKHTHCDELQTGVRRVTVSNDDE